LRSARHDGGIFGIMFAMDNEATPTLDLGSIDFTPDWAKKDAGVVVGKTSPVRDFGDRKPFGDKRQLGDRKPFDRKGGGDRRPFDRTKPARGQSDRPPRFADRPRPLDADVKILPETKALGTVMRKLQQDYHAYKLKDLAYFFLDNPSTVLLKITARKRIDDKGVAQPSALGFCQCKACGFASTSEADVVAHAVQAHLGDYYDSKDVECEPPKGNFSCVAKCGLSGVLLGPPNIHEFNATVREMIRTRYPAMSEAEYRSHIVMVREPEAIEEWRKGATKKTVFTAKGAGEGAGELTREQAEAEFKRTYLAAMLDTPKNLMITADVAMKSPVKPLQWAAKDALEAERRSPYNMCFALRGAFHHRKMHFFRANDARGQEFVTGVELKEFDAAHAIPELAKVATFIAEHPCSPKVDIVSDADGEKHLAWLASTGHVVAFTNGVYSAVEKFPKYGPQWQKRSEPKKAPEPSASEPEPVKEQVAVNESEPPASEPEPVKAPEPVNEPEAVKEPESGGEPEAPKKEEVKDEATPKLAE